MSQAITNLTTNAIKFSPANEKVVIEITSEKDQVELCVRDMGIRKTLSRKSSPADGKRKTPHKWAQGWDSTSSTGSFVPTGAMWD